MMFSRTLSSPTRPSALRSSGQKAMPLCSDWCGELWATGAPRSVRCARNLRRIAPNINLVGFRAARPQQASQSDDFAGTQGQVERLHGAFAPEALGYQNRFDPPWLRGTRRRASTCSSSRPIIIEISFSLGQFGGQRLADQRPLRSTDMRSEIS